MSLSFDHDKESVRGLMRMTVYSIIADVLKVDLDNIKPLDELVNDLGMTSKKQASLQQNIKEMFDELVIDFSSITYVQDLTDQILKDEFDNQSFLEDYF